MKNNDSVTKRDLEEFGVKLEIKIDKKLNGIRDEMKQWHSDVFDLVDGLASEVKNNQDFREITTHQIVEDRERIGKLEKKVFGVVSI